MPNHGRRSDQRKPGLSRRKWLSALGLGGATALAGCAGGEGTETAAGTPTPSPTEGDAFGTEQSETEATDVELPPITGPYRTVASGAAETLNPLYNSESGAAALIANTLDQGFGFAPGTSQFQQIYELSTEDNQVWVATLRDNLQFSDPYGQVTADDFVYQVQELQQAEWTTTADSDSWSTDEVENIEATGDLEFQIELASARPLYLESYDPLLYPIPADLMRPYVEEEDDEGIRQDEELNNLSFTGNLGPYTLEERNPGGVTRFSRNEDYYFQAATDIDPLFENAPYFEGVTHQVVGEVSSRLGALKDGEIDVAAIPQNRLDEFQNDVDEVYVNLEPTPFNEVIKWNMRENGWNAGPGNLFRNRKVRQGLSAAANKNDFVEGILRGLGNPEFTWQPRFSQFYPGDDVLTTYGVGDLYGAETAQSLIEEGISELGLDYGYDSEGRLINPSGEQVTLSLYHSAGQPVERSFGQYVAQEYERNAGIKVEVNAIQGAQFDRQYAQNSLPEDANADELEYTAGPYNAGPRDVATSQNPWDMEIVYGLNTYPLNPATAATFFLKQGGFNYVGYEPEWDAASLFDQASSASSREELASTVEEIMIEISEAVPYGMMATTSDSFGYRNPIQGPQENFFNGWDSPAWHRDEEMN